MQHKLKAFFSPKELAASLSLANLFFLRVWQELIFAEPAEQFYLKTTTVDSLLAVILNVILLALIFRLAVYYYQRRLDDMPAGKWGGLFLFLALLPPLNALRLLMPGLSFAELSGLLGNIGLALLLVLFFSTAIFAAARWSRQFVRATVVVLLIFSPFLFFTFSQAVWGMISADPAHAPGRADPDSAAAADEHRPDRRVLWLVFDELDQRMTFEERPPSVETPALDAILEKAIFADEAYAPGEDTLVSMPAFITGRKLTDAEPVSPDELMLFFEGKEDRPEPWSEQENVFSRAADLGYQSGLLGCFLPYCRVIGHTATRCYWQPFGTVELKKDLNLAQIMAAQLSSTFSLSPFNRRGHALSLYRHMLDEAKCAAADPNLGVVLVHWSIPHYPWIYDRHAGDHTIFNYDMQKGYFDNLALVDRTLSKLQSAMEKSGTWEDTHLIITSDHPWRMELFPTFDGQTDPRVPFIVRLAGQDHPCHYRLPFDTTATHDLVLHLLEGRFSHPEEVMEWMERQPPPPVPEEKR